MSVERIARIETKLEHISATMDELRTTQLSIVKTMDEARGAARASKAITHGMTAMIAFAVSQFGGFIHIR